MNIESIIQSCKKKERAAQRMLVDALAPYLFSIAKRYVKQTEDAKDVLQDSLIKIFKNIDKCQVQEAAFRAWCKRIVINTALERFRRAARVKELYPGKYPNEPEQFPQAIEQLQTADILRLLERLPEIQKQVFNLYVIDGYRHAEIADMLQIQESSSRTTYMRARRNLQELIKKSDKIRS
ncbi:MAG: RNA polymerase sigma factor [Bacteroidota bacterium]